MFNKNKKKTAYTFLPYECTAAEEYLEIMAEKGWVLEDIKGKFFEFKKIEPKKIKYLVDVIHKVSIYDYKNSDMAIKYKEYRQASGWDYICETGKVQIFNCLEDRKRNFFYTDEEEKFKSVIKASLYYGGGKFLLGLIIIFNIYSQLFMGDAGFALTSNLVMFSTVGMFSVLLISSIEVISFFIWVIKARIRLNQDEIMFYKKYKQKSIKSILKKSYGIIIILLCLQSYILANYHIGGFIVSKNNVSNNEVNLTLIDFGFKENNNSNDYIEFNKSIVAEKVDYYSGNLDNNLDYTIFQSKYPWIIKFYEKRLLNKYDKKYGYGLKSDKTNLPINIKVYSDINKRSFILVSKDKVVYIKEDFNDMNYNEILNIVHKKLYY